MEYLESKGLLNERTRFLLPRTDIAPLLWNVLTTIGIKFPSTPIIYNDTNTRYAILDDGRLLIENHENAMISLNPREQCNALLQPIID